MTESMDHDERMQIRWGAIRPVLSRIPDEVWVRKNQVGNLSFFDDNGEWLGFLEIYQAQLTWFPDEDESDGDDAEESR